MIGDLKNSDKLSKHYSKILDKKTIGWLQSLHNYIQGSPQLFALKSS